MMLTKLITDVTLVVFLIINIVQVITIIYILIYAVTDVYRRCNSPSLGVRTNRLITREKKNFAFIGGGVSEEAVFRFRKILTPEKVGNFFSDGVTKEITEGEKPGKKKIQSILSLLKRGHEPTAKEKRKDFSLR